MILTRTELIAITRRDRPSAQARVLKRLGIPFRFHPLDGMLLVPREAALSALGGTAGAKTESPEFRVNVNAIRDYGQKAKAKRS